MKKIKESDVTPESIFLMKRRNILKLLGVGAATAAVSSMVNADVFSWFSNEESNKNNNQVKKILDYLKPNKYQSDLILTPENKVIGYNNFYEFGLNKSDPEKHAGQMETDNWVITIDGEVNNPLTLDMDDIYQGFTLEERIYRMRCVEAWSMAIPWVGFPLSKLLSLADPNSKAKYVSFQTLYDPESMPGQKNSFIGGGIQYPYVEGLRIDEAMNPLTLLAVGVYGKSLPNQNGAPIRLVVPWKYGFKSIKSIVNIKLTEKQPPTTWNLSNAAEYGFYANVNPDVNHPRWSQATERFIGSGGISSVTRQPTLLFNGYQDQVSSLYRKMNLAEYY